MSKLLKAMKKAKEQKAPYNNDILLNQRKEMNGVFIGTPCTGLVRMEWALARFSQVIPCNWGYQQAIHWIPSMSPIGFLVADAQNLIVKKFLESNQQWLILVEQDNVLPSDFFLRCNQYIRKNTIPVVSGLYFTKTLPAEPILYRGRSNSYFTDWKIGDKVWVDAVPTGCLLIARPILETLWKESEVYVCGSPPQETRRVFDSPEKAWYIERRGWHSVQGTSDMEFCSRCIVKDIFKKAGWPKIQKKQYPFLVDTGIFVGHIDNDGRIYPSDLEKNYWTKPLKERNK
jgi:hypothetical protein